MKVTTDGCLFGAWVAYQLKGMQEEPKYGLDIGTGTGLLPLMLAQVTHLTQFDAIEINTNSFEQAIENFKNAPWHNRLHAVHSSLQKFEPPVKYDLIISNPPFFKNHLLGPDSNKNQALHSNDLSFQDLAHGVNKNLADQGAGYIMYPEWEMSQFIETALRSGLYCHQLLMVRNQQDGNIFRIMAKFGKNKRQVEEHELCIKKNQTSYSDQFNALLNDYYL